MQCPLTTVSNNILQRALETIGGNLQRQYERWQPRARYRQSLDPTVEEVRRLATGLRRSAREERVLFHYNGHGVPRPTANGEIWVFNRFRFIIFMIVLKYRYAGLIRNIYPCQYMTYRAGWDPQVFMFMTAIMRGSLWTASRTLLSSMRESM